MAFELKKIFDEKLCQQVITKFNFNLKDPSTFQDDYHNCFKDFIILSLSENSSHTKEERNKIYIEASAYLRKSENLLLGMPHPAGSMSYKLKKMSETLDKVVTQKKNNNAIRFIEKNLARSFVRFWNIYSDNKVNGSESIENHEVIEFFMISIEQAYLHYSEIEWFNSCNLDDLKNLFKSI